MQNNSNYEKAFRKPPQDKPKKQKRDNGPKWERTNKRENW